MEAQEKAVGFPRVVSETIKPFTYTAHCSPTEGEAIEVRAVGVWRENATPVEDLGQAYPVSIHITVPPGCAFIPATGDHLKVTIERATGEEQSAEYDAMTFNIKRQVERLKESPV